MRGKQEQKCLDFVKNEIFFKEGQLLRNPFTNKTYLEVSDKEFLEQRDWFINQDCHKYYFGLLEEDRMQIESILRSAKPNINASEFPDFIFDEGFIEHFQVTSSRTTRKGAIHKKKEQQFQVKVSKETEIVKQEWNEIPSYNEVRSKHWRFDNPEHSYDYFVKSFQDILEHHINSLNKYSGSKKNGIFLIEYTEFALSMIENVYGDWKDGMSQGDMREEEKFHSYRLSRDKKLLNFIYQYKEQIKYVIFVYNEGFEIIKLENVPYLLKLLPWDFIIYPLAVWQMSSVYNISVPVTVLERDEDNDEDKKVDC